MALGTNHETITTSANFIPEVWSDEVLAAYKANLVASQLVKKIGFRGKKGDTIHVPKPARGAASAKAASTQVTLITDTAGVLNISIDQHWEYSRLIEDIAEVQRLASARAFYTDDAGYALAKKVDSALLAHAGSFQGGSAYSTAVIGSDGTTVWNPAASTNTGNGADLSDAGLRRAIQTLDDNDVPLDMRSLLINPGQKNVLLGITRFSSSDFIGGRDRVNTGVFGEVYGAKVYVTTNLPTVLAADSSTAYKACVLMGKEAIVHAEQMAVRTQTQYKQEYLGTLFTADTIYGTSVYRDTSGVALIVPA